MAEPRYTGDTLKQELSNHFLASPSDLRIVDGTTIDGEVYMAIVNELFRSNILAVYKEYEEDGETKYEKVLEERRDANTFLFPEDDYKHALKLFEEVKKRKKCE